MMRRRLALASLVLLAACATPKPSDWTEGGLYSTQGETGRFVIAKILKPDSLGVHVRLYSNTFPERPATIDESTLHLAGMQRRPDEALGMGHLPLLRASFTDFQPVYIKTVPVEDAELEGYRMWLEAKGGYF